MAWNDDSWRDSYDDWKLASPDYEDEEPCDHEDHETDILDGRCRCYRCGHSWYATATDIDRELRFQSEFAEAMEREERRQWWSDLYYKMTPFLRPWRRWRARNQYDDEIPF
ncbi:hypothetical protein AYJ54_00855 [Bradyrhizobium centrolobii]|uniref:Uncharacterized protein n=1 Tax=Bradyrhizobium centrolobii TaxID=1505087 RepID=A0A176YHI6_9BRAD|nr:hypothetical protein [Bradyrhizobium centrolobii]OAF05488.1 hypothetical protein AYJ54_00855 [Bradyrhizobium centrolobii]